MPNTTTLSADSIKIDIDLGSNMSLPHLHALHAGLEALIEKVKQQIAEKEAEDARNRVS